jgi:hypothetical protein
MDHSTPNEAAPAPVRRRKFSRTSLIAGAAIVLILLAGIIAWVFMLNPTLVKKNQYQAVFLTNGQVYFGKLESGGPQFIRLKDVYYLQTTQDLQKTDEAKAADTSNQTQTLIRLGKEIHGPDNEMLISRSQVLFFENISNDGTVGKAIASDKNKK